MDAPVTPAPKTTAPQSTNALQQAWPRSAQMALACLIGSLLTLLAVHAYGYLRWGTRPAELERAVGIAYRIDLNRASRAELLQLPGIGESLARRIEDYRHEHGSFRQVNDLIEVRGIGPATLERLRPWVQVKYEPGEMSEEVVNLERPVSKPRIRDSSRPESVPARKTTSKEAGLTAPIDINRASLTELQRLPGVGPKMSQRIVEEREKAPFKSVEDLRRVHGIGPKTLERLRPHVTVRTESLRVVTAEQTDVTHDQP